MNRSTNARDARGLNARATTPAAPGPVAVGRRSSLVLPVEAPAGPHDSSRGCP